MQKASTLLSRSTAIALALLLVAASLAAVFITGRASAGIPTARSITLSTSQGGATDVTYTVGFTAATTGTMQGLVIEFCDSTPIIGDTCTAPTGFDVNESGVAITDTIAGGAFAVDALTDANTLILTRTDATSITASTAVTLTLGGAGGADGVTNPTAGNHTFYARILTYVDNDDDGNGCSDVDDNATCYASATPRTYNDAGGVALSTANQLQITSKVQERLQFCIYTSANCLNGGVDGTDYNTTGAGRISAISLGNTQGVLDPAGPFVDKSAKFDVSTNASSGVTIVMKGDVLKTGALEISSSANSGMGAAAGTAYASSAGNEQFGFCAYEASANGVTFSAPYNNAACNSTSQTSGTGATGGVGTANFGFNRTDATSASGSTVASKPAGTLSTATMAFVGNIAFTTEAGIYQTTLTFIATGTY